MTLTQELWDIIAIIIINNLLHKSYDTKPVTK